MAVTDADTTPAVNSEAQSSPPDHSSRLVALLAVAGIVVAMTQTLVVPLIASLPQIFDAPASDTSWIVTTTLLVGAVCTPVAGKLADMYGKKRMLLISLVPLLAGSIVCALATNVPVMVVGRGLQGMATGFIPLGISMLHDLLPKERTASAISLMSSSLGIGGAVGLPFAAAVAEFSSWRILFWIIAGASAIIWVLVAIVVPSPTKQGTRHQKFDFVGAFGLAAGLVVLLLAISKGSEWGWTSPLVLGMLLGAVVVLVAWGWWELRVSGPLVDLRTTAKPVVLMTDITSILIGFAMYAQSLILPQLMQLPTETGYGLGQNMLQMGLWMAPAGLAMTLMSPVGARLTRSRGPKVTLSLGAVIMAVGYGLAALSMHSLVALMGTAFIASAGVGLAYGAMPELILGAVPSDEKASANSLNALMRSIGTSASAAVIGVVLANLTITFGERAVPSAQGFLISLLVGSGVALVAAVVAATIPTRVHPVSSTSKNYVEQPATAAT